MAWCCQATSHYLGQCWPWTMSPNGVTRPQWLKLEQTRSTDILPAAHAEPDRRTDILSIGHAEPDQWVDILTCWPCSAKWKGRYLSHWTCWTLVGWLSRSMYAGYISRPHKGEAPKVATELAYPGVTLNLIDGFIMECQSGKNSRHRKSYQNYCFKPRKW